MIRLVGSLVLLSCNVLFLMCLSCLFSINAATRVTWKASQICISPASQCPKHKSLSKIKGCTWKHYASRNSQIRHSLFVDHFSVCPSNAREGGREGGMKKKERRESICVGVGRSAFWCTIVMKTVSFFASLLRAVPLHNSYSHAFIRCLLTSNE